MLICVRCGAENSDTSKFCNNCQAALPQIPAASRGHRDPDKVMDRFYQVEEAVKATKSGEWTVDEYADFLDNISEVLAQKEDEIRAIELPDDLYEEFSDELESGFEGMALFNEGINHLMSYVEDQDTSHLDYGMDLCLQGSEKLNDAMRLNRLHKKKLEDLIDTTTLM